MYDGDEEKRLSTLERGHALSGGEEGRLMVTLALQVGRVEGRYEQERRRHDLGLKALVIDLSVTRDALKKQQLSASDKHGVGEVEQAVVKSLGVCLREKAARIERNISSHKLELFEATDRLQELAAVDVEVAEELKTFTGQRAVHSTEVRRRRATRGTEPEEGADAGAETAP
jgi:hypothetical protein